jgi:hypothetical protein
VSHRLHWPLQPHWHLLTSQRHRWGDQVIIVSEPSADATRRVRTERPTSARSRSSAPHNDTPWYTDARPISVHTEEHNRIRDQPCLRRVLTTGWPQAGREGGGAPEGAGIPSHRRRGCSRPGAGVEVVQPSGAPPRPPRLAYFRTSPPTRRDTRSTPPFIRAEQTMSTAKLRSPVVAKKKSPPSGV